LKLCDLGKIESAYIVNRSLARSWPRT